MHAKLQVVLPVTQSHTNYNTSQYKELPFRAVPHSATVPHSAVSSHWLTAQFSMLFPATVTVQLQLITVPCPTVTAQLNTVQLQLITVPCPTVTAQLNTVQLQLITVPYPTVTAQLTAHCRKRRSLQTVTSHQAGPFGVSIPVRITNLSLLRKVRSGPDLEATQPPLRRCWGHFARGTAPET
jgi:hypothetical protein